MKTALITTATVLGVSLSATATAEAAILIDTDFSNVTGADLAIANNNKLERNGANDATGLGWLISGAAVNQTSFNDATNEFTAGPAAAFFGDSDTSFLQSFGQLNEDNGATTGPVSFDFEVTSVDLDGGETISFLVQAFEFTGTTQVAGNNVDLNAPINGSLFSPIGSASTANVTAAGTFSTGTIDFGTGVDVVAIRIVAIDAGSANFGDTITLGSITPAVIPEPTAGLAGLALGGLLAARRRR
ncbi:MAG: hypothetical protein AAF656_06390 [Planctomycetota bacterium]